MDNKLKHELKIPRWDQIPDMGLYMEQVISFVNTALGPSLEEISYPPLTSNMVNNYVKAKIVEAPVNKRYSRLSVAMIIVVYILKMCYSTDEVSQLLGIGVKLVHPKIVYNRFCKAVETAVRDVFEGKIYLSDEGLPDRRYRYLLGNFALSFACKFYVHKVFLEGKDTVRGV